ncbi:MAG: sigma-70 family RNA polymerase sigma factor [Deltaproteobacteria bacterium]|nr:sigma-70 family RNA polymerase sigma factor [Deltaproteobacteria bacterium]
MHRAHSAYAPARTEDDVLIERHATMLLRLSRSIAARTGNPSIEGDLWTAGALGLVDAARRFEHGRGAKFESFAEHRVRGAMLDELRRLDHLPRRMRARSEQVAKARRKMTQELGRTATDDEIAGSLGMSTEELTEVEGAALPPAPLDPELIPEGTGPAPDEELDRSRKVMWLTQQVKNLPERLRTVLGLIYQEGCTYREIAQMMDVSEPRICQLHAQALELLREAAGSKMGDAA